MLIQLRRSIVLCVICFVFFGFIYALAGTGISQLLFKHQADGSLTEKHLFCKLGSDGMTRDERGNIYLTGHGVTVFDPTGKKIEHIDVNEPWTANITFGGADHKTLFITASKSVYTIQMNVRGAF